MKKSNVILTAVAGVASVFLLWLWFHLGFNQVDSPLDLFLSIIWRRIIGIGAAAIAKLEKTRCERIRTVYLGDGRLYNSEVGVQMMTPGVAATDALAAIINALEYDFDRVDGPDPDNESERIDWRYIVHTAKYQVDEDAELISIYYGADVTQEDAENLKARVEERYPSCDIELQYGGQPIYSYIISAE